LTKTASKAQAAILIAAILIAIVSTYYFTRDHLLKTKSPVTPPSPHSAETLTATLTISAAPTVSNDSNWAGYITASDLQNPQPAVTSISASWVIPTVTPSAQSDTFAAIWIGIGGYFEFDNSLIQVGTEQDSIGGQGEYSAWYELLPDYAITIDTITVSPGDKINASLQLVDPNTDTWSIYIEDLSTSQAFQNDFIYTSSQLSAEWIVERPTTENRLSNLATIGTVTFTNCEVIVGAQSGDISNFPAIQSIMYESLQNTDGIKLLAVVSNLTDSG
jgi:hypothetical protein